MTRSAFMQSDSNPTDDEIQAWLTTNVVDMFWDALVYLKRENPNVDHNWGFIKSALIAAIGAGYSPNYHDDQGRRQLNKMKRQLPFFVPKRGE